ncbi:MAG TPA: M23 family metallopeptidase [Sphingomicrobium sp.]|nr:M23 family metallopeptidase [Sphingomicrobium sp.]
MTFSRALFSDREFFIHDGRQLRRFRLSAPVQSLLLFLSALLVGWSAYSAAQLVAPSLQAEAAIDPYKAQLAKLAAETDRRVKLVEARQLALAAALRDEHINADALKRLGFYPAAGGGIGGPANSEGGDPTFKQLFTSWKKLDTLAGGAIAIPSDKPVKTAEFTSAYGMRTDPFRRGASMHAGIDLAGPTGTPIHATADGVVARAGWNSGGYGNIIEIDHGRGITTRYAHLSKMNVQAGERVSRGQVIGKMGSTGRSTGSHLHYEVRIDNRPVNPIPFMRSTDYLVAMKKAGSAPAMDAVALGGPEGSK